MCGLRRMVCEEKSIAYDLKEAGPRSPEAFAIHPFGKIPVLRHGDFELCESKAIATYLDLGFPGPKLIPTEPRHAALTEQWVSLVNTRIDTTMIRTYLFAYIFPKTEDGRPDRQAIAAVAPARRARDRPARSRRCQSGLSRRRQLDLCRHQPDADFVPDAQHFPEGVAAIAAAKPLADYYQRLAARPSFQNTIPPPGSANAPAVGQRWRPRTELRAQVRAWPTGH